MKIDKLTKLIDLIVEDRIEKLLPKLVKEELSRVLNESNTKTTNQKSIQTKVSKPTKSIKEGSKKNFSKNPLIDSILNETTPFNGSEKYGDYETSERTIGVDSTFGVLDRDSLKTALAAKMGYGAYTPDGSSVKSSGEPKSGLGVKTGIASLDRVLNRDNTELVKKMMEKKVS
jgi:hypothetical protein